MSTFFDDAVRLELGSDEVLVAESYEVTLGVMTQPSAFSLKMGHIGVVADLMKRYPPRSPFRLSIANALQQTGWTDSVTADIGASETSVSIRGRDRLAPLLDGYVTSERSFADTTYRFMVEEALNEVGVSTLQLGEAVIVDYDSSADRMVKTGVPLDEIAPAFEGEESSFVGKDGKSVTTSTQKKVVTHIGERWFEFVRRQLDRAGLFLWCGADGRFIISRPNRKQKPAYRIVRSLDLRNDAMQIVSSTLTNDTTHRYSDVVIHGRTGAKKYGRVKISGSFEDPEMKAFGYKRSLVFKDGQMMSDAQAILLARRKIAESRRAGFQLSYKMAGHSTPTLDGKGRAVWSPDTLVDVYDEILGIDEPMYIESVTHASSPERTSTVRLMRPKDLVFGLDDGDGSA